MSEILQNIILPFLSSAILTGGIGSIFYIRQNRKLKEFEVKAAELENKNKEITNVSAVNEEWETFTKNIREENQTLRDEKHSQDEIINNLNDKIEKLNLSREEAWEKYSDCRIECAKKDRIISELNWYRCEINNCPYRKPPRKFGDFDFPENAVIKTDEE